ncbi:phage tail assembly protein [Pseudomonas sp. B11D7D]|nr:phage tail assembly protein [Pseudomonas sp. B11D7D]QNH04450.1 phage tail assembly protein [Pseudomonas sp. B11D7D]
MSQPIYSAPIELAAPIGKITSITLRRPGSGELRGLKLADLVQGDVTAVTRLLPRITQPTLVDQEVAAMDVFDLTRCADEIAVFLQTPPQKPAAEASPE